jgi:G3E family GTPase
MITVVDSATFIKDYSSRAPIAGRPELGEGGGMRPVVDLLVEQVECADFIVLNKIDLLDEPTLDSLGAIVSSLNPLARIVRAAHGEVPVADLLGPESTGLVAKLNVEGQHRGAVAAARSFEEEEQAEKEENEKHHHEHKHDHHNHEDGGHCSKCDEEGHDHAHHHHTHDHEKHHHHHEKHDHSHKKPKKERQTTTAAARFGILSFVYLRRRPFHPQRLKDLVLRWMPVSHNKALDAEKGEAAAPEAEASPIRTVLRSKGFMWLSNGHTTAYYWSHAGQHFEIRDEGEWWTAVPDEDWPQHPAQRATVLADFDPQGVWGDRRQEIVFIGAGMDKEAISAQLDGALLTESEMEQYKQQYKDQTDPPHPSGADETAAGAAGEHHHH